MLYLVFIPSLANQLLALISYLTKGVITVVSSNSFSPVWVWFCMVQQCMLCQAQPQLICSSTTITTTTSEPVGPRVEIIFHLMMFGKDYSVGNVMAGKIASQSLVPCRRQKVIPQKIIHLYKITNDQKMQCKMIREHTRHTAFQGGGRHGPGWNLKFLEILLQRSNFTKASATWLKLGRTLGFNKW